MSVWSQRRQFEAQTQPRVRVLCKVFWVETVAIGPVLAHILHTGFCRCDQLWKALETINPSDPLQLRSEFVVISYWGLGCTIRQNWKT